MSKRTYAGPIIERGIEWGIVFGDDGVGRSSFYHLAVDSGTGELVILDPQYVWLNFVDLHNPVEYVPAGRGGVVFTVTDDLSEVRGEETTPREQRVFAPMLNGDWPEDFSHENGQYLNTCRRCQLMFIGHKRRVTCKWCAKNIPPTIPMQGEQP